MANTREEAEREAAAIRNRYGPRPTMNPRRAPKPPPTEAAATLPQIPVVVLPERVVVPEPVPVVEVRPAKPSPRTPVAPVAKASKPASQTRLTKAEHKEARWRVAEAKIAAIVQQLHKDRDDPTSPEFIDLNNLRGLRI